MREQANSDRLDRGGGRLLFSLQGFLIQLTDHDTQPLPLAALVAVAAVATLMAIERGDQVTAAAAAMLGSLLIFHSLIYDWTMLIPAAILLALRPAPATTRIPTVALLLLPHLAASAGFGAPPGIRSYSPQFWMPPAGLALLLWLAAVPLLEVRIRRPPGGPELLLDPKSPA